MAKRGKTGGAYTPKKRSSGFSVEGKSVEELLKNGSSHLHQYNESNLRAIVNRLSSAGNKRLRRFEASGMADSPAIAKVKESGGKFSSKDKNKEELKAEFLRLKDFFENPTSTQAGWERAQRRAEREAVNRGILNNKKGKKPVAPSGSMTPPPDFVEGGEYADPEIRTSWVLDEETGTYHHPVYGTGWKYDEQLDAFVDPVTEEVIANPSRERMYHDYDSTSDWRVIEGLSGDKSTETGEIWRMVDSLVALNPSFSSSALGGDSTGAGKTLRNRLFDAIDEAWVKNPGWSFEDARDYVATQLDKIEKEHNEFLGEAAEIGKSRFM